MNHIVGSDMFRQRIEAEASHDAPHREFKRGAMIAGAFFLGLLGWAAVTPLDAAAFGQGVVIVSGNRQVVQHRQGGIITALYVTDGQPVEKGDPLAVVSASELIAAERGTASEVISLLAMRARLTAESKGAASVAAPSEFAALEGEDRVLAETAMAGQRALFNARRASLGTERAVLGQRIAQHQEQIGGIRHQLRANEVQQRLIEDEVEGLKSLLPKGYVSVNRLRAMERLASELDGTYGAHRADIARSNEAIGETRLQIASLRRQMITEVAGQLREVQMRLDELQPKLLSLRDQVARSVVRAPASGRVVGMSVFTVGGVVAPGETLMEIVPQDRDLVIEGKVSPTEADDLAPGMETQVNFTALQERSLPILMGEVTKVSADSLEDERSGERYFRIEVVVPPREMAKLKTVRSEGIQPGLPADILIPLRKRSALSYLVEPLTQTLWLAGREN